MQKARTLRGAALGLSLIFALSAPGLAQEDVEDPAGKPITTVDSYTYVPSEVLPPVEGVSNYKFDDKTVVFPINLWIGWAPIIMANGGLEPNENSIFSQKYGFKLKLAIVDNPIQARDGFASGNFHILWGTLDMMALFAPELAKDSRTSLRIFQQIDWSNGGDGIVARGGIKSINDLRPSKDGKLKKVALAEMSPSHYFLLNMLYYAGIKPDQVTFRFTGDAFQAARAFVSDKSVDACVSWAPDIYNISDPEKSKIPDVKLIASTLQAKRVIADVWAARADFARDHPEVIKGLVQGIFEGMSLVKDDWETAAGLFESAFGLPEGDATAMQADAHLTNYFENYDFFCNRNNPSNFESTWENICNIYRLAGYLPAPVSFDKVMDNSVIMALQDAYKKNEDHNKDNYGDKVVVDLDLNKVEESGEEIVTRSVYIHFAPNRSDVDYSVDPNAEAVIKEIGLMAAQFGDAQIIIVGHADRSKYDQAKGLGDEYFKKHSARVLALSEDRANGVLLALKDRFPEFKEGKFYSKGEGWNKPLETDALSRRVEIRVMTLEE